MATKGYPGGFAYLHLWRNTNGYMTGQVDGSAASNGDESSAYFCETPKVSSFSPAEPVSLDITGGDIIAATMSFGNRKLNPFDISIADVDPALFALLSSSAVDETANSEYEMFSNNPNNAVFPSMGLCLTQRFQPAATGSDGPEVYHSVIIPLAKIAPVFSGMQFQGEATVNLRVTPSMTDTHPLGTVFSAMAMALYRNRCDHFHMVHDYPLQFHFYKGADSGTEFTLPYKPVSSVVTVDATPNWLAKDGTDMAASAVDTGTGAVTIPSASDGEMYVMISQTEEYEATS